MKKRRNSRNEGKRQTVKNKNQPTINSKRVIYIAIAFIVLIFFSTIFALINSISTKILARTQINGINVSSQTIDEAYQKLNEELKNKVSKNLIVKDEEYEVNISLEQLEVTYKTEEAVNKAYKIGRDKNILRSNYQIIKTILLGNKIEQEIIYSEEQLNNIIEDIEAKLPEKLTQSSYCIEESNLIITSGKKGKVVKKEELKDKLIQAIKEQIYGKEVHTINLPIEVKEPDPINIEQIYGEIKKDATNAYYEKNPFVLHKEEQGIDFNISLEEAREIVKEEKEEYVIPLKITKPEIILKDLKYEDFFPNELSRFITRYDESNTNRSTNIKLSSEKIDGTVLMPGETFSYNKTVGERTIRAGYKEAAVYVGGKIVNGIGGGICQVSSTLYNAALQANLDIISRRNHYFITAYVSPSRDATVAYGSIDFKFKNTRTYPIKIQCIAKNGICQINIYGIKEKIEYEVEIQDTVTEIIPYTTKYIETNEMNKGEEEETQKGVNGYKSEAYKILKLNGTVVSKTLLSKDSYNPLQRTVKKGNK